MLPPLHPDKPTTMFFYLMAKLIFGLVRLIKLYKMLIPLWMYCENLSEFYYLGLALPKPRENTSPLFFMPAIGVLGFPLHYFDKIQGAPQAQSTKLPGLPNQSSKELPTVITCNSLYSYPLKRTIQLISVQMPKSFVLWSLFRYCLPQLYEKAGFPLWRQTDKSIVYFVQRCYNILQADVFLQAELFPIGKSFYTSVLLGKVKSVPFVSPEGLAKGKQMIRAALRMSYALRRILGLSKSLPLNPLSNSTVKFLSGCSAIYGFYERKQKFSHFVSLHLSPSVEYSLSGMASCFGTLFFQSSRKTWYFGCQSAMAAMRNRQTINIFIYYKCLIRIDQQSSQLIS